MHPDFRDVKNVNRGNMLILRTGYSGKNKDHSAAVSERMLIMVLISSRSTLLRSDAFACIIYLKDVRGVEKQNFGTDPESLPRMRDTNGALSLTVSCYSNLCSKGLPEINFRIHGQCATMPRQLRDNFGLRGTQSY